MHHSGGCRCIGGRSGGKQSRPTVAVDDLRRTVGTPPRFLPELLDLEAQRLADMDRNGVDMQLLSLTAPGVQMFDANTGTSLAILANDRLAEVARRHPTRFAALASFAPQDPRRAVLEMERAIKTLRFNGFIVNSIQQ